MDPRRSASASSSSTTACARCWIEVAPLADHFEQGDATAAVPLRDQAASLYESFETHLLHEEAALLPLLRARGPRRATGWQRVSSTSIASSVPC